MVPYQFTDMTSPPENIDIYQVTSTVTWSDIGGTHEITLSSLRLAIKQP
jgi:general secretion pathway protein I